MSRRPNFGGMGGMNMQQMIFVYLPKLAWVALSIWDNPLFTASMIKSWSISGSSGSIASLLIFKKDPCDICSDSDRDQTTIMVVEQPKDVMAFEDMGEYDGLYQSSTSSCGISKV